MRFSRVMSLGGILLLGATPAFLSSVPRAQSEPLASENGDVSPESRADMGVGQRTSRGGDIRGPLKHIGTSVTTIEIWIPFLGWTVISEATTITCGPRGNNCPFEGS